MVQHHGGSHRLHGEDQRPSGSELVTFLVKMMDTERALIGKNQRMGRMRQRDLLLHQPDALRLIEDFRRSRLVIRGMDFWRETDRGLIELPSSADYSSLSKAPDAIERSADAAQRLIQNGLPDGADWVSFVIGR